MYIITREKNDGYLNLCQWEHLLKLCSLMDLKSAFPKLSDTIDYCSLELCYQWCLRVIAIQL